MALTKVDSTLVDGAINTTAAGNVGIGTASPTAKLDVVGNVRTTTYYNFNGNASNPSDPTAAMYDQSFVGPTISGNAVAFRTGTSTPAERVRIESGGNVNIGVSGLGYGSLSILNAGISTLVSRLANNPSDINFQLNTRNGVAGGSSGTEMARLCWGYAGTDNAYISAERNAGTGANRINVVCNMSAGVFLSAGGGSWGSLSDERQKTNLVPIADASDKLNTLRTVTGRYITDEETVSRAFLIAQDVQKVLPEAVDVQENEEGTLGLRYTELIPLLVAGFKEQQAIITDLKARIETLEAK
jgi:hypothetical protein